MVRLKKSRLLFVLFLFLTLLFLIQKIKKSQKDRVSNSLPKSTLLSNLSRLTVIILEFENFDNDVINTCQSVLKACQHQCNVFVVSEDLVYPPLRLPGGASHFILKPDILRPVIDVKNLLRDSKYILFLPDGARISSFGQLNDHIHLLEAGDAQIVALSVGGLPLVCHQYALDIRAWTLVVTPAPHSEACDGVNGRATFLLRTKHLVNLTFPLLRPLSLSLSIQGVARGWKIHVSRGSVLGEGRHLFATDHLQWKYQSIIDKKTKMLYKNLGIKKVVESNHHVEWYGCTRTSPRCFPSIANDTPSYLYEGRWTPPCCLEGLRATARHVFKTLHECRVRWWLEGGSLLGAVRSGDIIPWDYDVDIGIYAVDIERCPQLKSSRWQTLEDSKGYVWQRSASGNFYQVQFSTANHLHIDIFPFQAKDGMMLRGGSWDTGHRQDVDFPEHFLRPLSSIMFAGVTAAAPNNVRDFLELKFGLGVIENPQYPNLDVLNSLNISQAIF